MKHIKFEIIGRYDIVNEPVTVTVPYRQGELHSEDVSSVTVYDQEKAYPTQTKVVSYYHDGTIRYLLVNFLADFPANHRTCFFVGATELPLKQTKTVQVETTDEGRVLLDNGYLHIELGLPGERLIRHIASPDTTLEKESIKGVVLYDEAKKSYEAIVGEKGWEIVEAGPVRSILRTTGRHVNADGHSFFSYQCMITVFAGKDSVRFAHQIINREPAKTKRKTHLTLTNEQAGLKYDTDYPFELLTGAEVVLIPDEKAKSKGIYTSSFNAHAQVVGPNECLSKTIDADSVIETANEMFPEVMFSTFAASWQGEKGQVIGSLYQAYQNFPKALDIDENKIVLSLFPRTAPALKVPQGVAKTLRFDLLFVPSGIEESKVVDKLLTLEMPPVGAVCTEEYVDASVFGPEVNTFVHHPTERFLYRFVDSRAKGLGILNFGDCPEWEYVKQGRSKGKDIWINNEYDMPHNFMVMFARSGDRRYYDYLMAAVRHWMDVDICHYSEEPYHEHLLYTHSVDHVSGQPVPSHQWVEGFLDYYHLTGDPNGYETAISLGDALLELIKLPIYHRPGQIEPREIGWALRALLALYQETGDKRYLDSCRPIVDVYLRWAALLGTWTSPYPDNYYDRVPFMMHVGLVGMYGYYRIAGGEEIRSTLLQVINDLVAECLNTRLNMFLGKQHPSIRYQNLNGMVLESLEIGYELTGDVEYLRKGLGMFQWITRENNPPIYDFSKIKRDDFTVIYNCPVGPKRCAQTLIPLLRYYAAAMKEGLLPSEN